MPYPYSSSKGYGGSGSSSSGVGSYSSIPSSPYMPGFSTGFLGRHDFISGRSPLYGGGGSGLGLLGYASSYSIPSSSYGSSYGSSPSYGVGYGAYTSTAGQKSYYAPLPTISEHSSGNATAANKRRMPRTYIPVVPLPSMAGNRPALYSSSGVKTLFTEDIDVTTPRKTAKPGDISRDKNNEGYGTIRRGRTVIRLETKKLKENPYLPETEKKDRESRKEKVTKAAKTEQKEKQDDEIPTADADTTESTKDYSHVSKWYEEEIKKPIKKERNAGDKFREKYMVQSKKNKHAGYRRPTLSDIRAQKAVVLKEIEERIKKLATVAPDEEISEELKAETLKLEKDKERLARLDKKMAKRFSKALRKAEHVNDGDTSDDESVCVDRQATVKALRRASSGTIKAADIPLTASSSNTADLPASVGGQRLTRKVTKRFFFPEEACSVVQAEIIEAPVAAEPADLFEQNILAQRQTVKMKGTLKKAVAHINQRKSSASDLEVPCDLISDKLCDAEVKEALEPTEELQEILEEIKPKIPTVKEVVTPPGRKKKYVKKVGDPPAKRVPGQILKPIIPDKDSDILESPPPVEEPPPPKKQPFGPKKINGIALPFTQGLKQPIVKNKIAALIPKKIEEESLKNGKKMAVFGNLPVKTFEKEPIKPKVIAADATTIAKSEKNDVASGLAKAPSVKVPGTTTAEKTIIETNGGTALKNEQIKEVVATKVANSFEESKTVEELKPTIKVEGEVSGAAEKSKETLGLTPVAGKPTLVQTDKKAGVKPTAEDLSNKSPLIARLKPKLALDNKSASFDTTTPKIKLDNKSNSLDSKDGKEAPGKKSDGAKPDITHQKSEGAPQPNDKQVEKPFQKKNAFLKKFEQNVKQTTPPPSTAAKVTPAVLKKYQDPISVNTTETKLTKEEPKIEANVISNESEKVKDVGSTTSQVKDSEAKPESPKSTIKHVDTKEKQAEKVETPKVHEKQEDKMSTKSDVLKKISADAGNIATSKQNLSPVKVQEQESQNAASKSKQEAVKAEAEVQKDKAQITVPEPTLADKKEDVMDAARTSDAIKKSDTFGKPSSEPDSVVNKAENLTVNAVSQLVPIKAEDTKVEGKEAKTDQKPQIKAKTPPSPFKKFADPKDNKGMRTPPPSPKSPVCKAKPEEKSKITEKSQESSTTASPVPSKPSPAPTSETPKLQPGKENKQAQNKLEVDTPVGKCSAISLSSLQNGHLSPPLTPPGKFATPPPQESVSDKQPSSKSPQPSEATQKQGAAQNTPTTITPPAASSKVEHGVGSSTEVKTNGPEKKEISCDASLESKKDSSDTITPKNKLGNLSSASENILETKLSSETSGQKLDSITPTSNGDNNANNNVIEKSLLEAKAAGSGEDEAVDQLANPELQSLIRKSLKRGSSDSSGSSSISSNSSTSTAKSESGSSTSSTLSAGSSAGSRSRRMPSPPVEDDEDVDRVALDKICPAKNRPKYRKYEIEDFQFLKVLGKGSFGKVLLAELKGADSYFAIKCLKKDVVLEDDDVECTMIERKVLLMGSKHPYLCHLFCTFQTESHLFFVMEYLNGGDLMFHIQQSGKFTEERARFYGAEIVSGLKFLHKRGVIYRDLKLDNILLDYEGHIRIADFGMCKLQIFLDRTADTFCGTPDYMAPEIIKGLRYNQCVDWWAFGVLMYEMLIGQSPFSGHDEEELFWSVCNEPVHYPRFLSKESKRLLELLLEKDASKRLGTVGCTHGDVKQQPFFQPIDWERLEKRDLEPPYKPKLKHSLDVQYFDTTFTKEAARLTPVDREILRSMDQTQFEGFSYTNPHTTD